LLYLKQSSGPVCGKAFVSNVEFIDNLTPEKINELKRQYNNQVLGTDEYWKSKNDYLYATIVWVERPAQIETLWISKKDWRGRVVLKKGADFGLLKCSNENE